MSTLIQGHWSKCSVELSWGREKKGLRRRQTVSVSQRPDWTLSISQGERRCSQSKSRRWEVRLKKDLSRAHPCDSSIMGSELGLLQVLGLPRLHGKTLIQRGQKDLGGKGTRNSLQSGSQGNSGQQDFPFLLEQHQEHVSKALGVRTKSHGLH